MCEIPRKKEYIMKLLTVDVECDGAGNRSDQVIVGRLAREHRVQVVSLQSVQEEHIPHSSLIDTFKRIVQEGVLLPPCHPRRRTTYSKKSQLNWLECLAKSLILALFRLVKVSNTTLFYDKNTTTFTILQIV